MDSFKGCLSSLEAGHSVKSGVRSALPEAEIKLIGLADGGEGTVTSLVESLGGGYLQSWVSNPLGKKVLAQSGLVGGLSILEVAASSGLQLIDRSQPGPSYTNSYGLGEMILAHLDRGSRKFLIGLGGSATNDLGVGMLAALGFKFLDGAGKELAPYPWELRKISSIDDSSVDKRIFQSSFTLACDVDNPLFGQDGAAHVFGPQKGASRKEIIFLDRLARHFSSLVGQKYGSSFEYSKGAGAAGGLGYAFKSFLRAEIRPGSQLIFDLIGLEEDIRQADLLITGEGSLDYQSLRGKAPVALAKLCKKHGLAVLALAGSVQASRELDDIFTAYFSIQSQPLSLEEALDPATTRNNLRNTSLQLMNIYKLRRP